MAKNMDFEEYLDEYKGQLWGEFSSFDGGSFKDYCQKRHEEKAFLCKARWCSFGLENVIDDKYCHYCDTNMGDRLKELNERYINEEK